jgi:hypothetical protein
MGPGSPVSRRPERVGARRYPARPGRKEHKEEDVSTTDIWTYRDSSRLGTDPTAGADVTGFEVEALDGSIGKVDEATYEVGSSYIVVDTGPWIFGKKVLLPAGVVQRIDTAEDRVFINRTKDQIKNAPEFDESKLRDESYRGELGTYYGRGGTGYRESEDV